MPVPSSIADLSSTASSNYPSGSESIGTSLDDYLRAHASIIKQVSDAYIAADATKQDASTAVTLTGTQTVQNKTLDTTNKFSRSAQIGSSGTATQNFSIEVPASPDGTMKLARGNSGATTQDILTVDASGRVTMTQNGPTVLHKVLTWTSPATGNATTSTAHGLSDMTKIVGLTGVLHTTTGGVAIGNQNPVADGNRLYALSFYWDSTNIYLRLADTCDPILVSRPVKVVIWYLP